MTQWHRYTRPSQAGYYIATWRDSANFPGPAFVTELWYSKLENQWLPVRSDDQKLVPEVIAWAELPEPYDDRL
jgi:hypothetical protein